MLQTSILRNLVASALFAFAVVGHAQDAVLVNSGDLTPEERAKKEEADAMQDIRDQFKALNQGLGNLAIGTELTPEQMEQAMSLGRILAEGAVKQSTQPGAIPGSTAQKVEQMRDHMDAIADESLAEERNKVLRAIGVDPKANSSLYYFVSYSMPLALLRSYVIEAMWSGGTLVFRGIPPGKKLAEFMFEDMKELVYDKGAAASLAIDPRLFDTYGIDKVPAIVVTTDRSGSTCATGLRKTWTYEDQTLGMNTCSELSSDKYHKMYGTVTTDFALRTFAEEGGSVESQRYLDALSRAYADGKRPGKGQVLFTGDWKSSLSTADITGAKRAREILEGSLNSSPSSDAEGTSSKAPATP